MKRLKKSNDRRIDSCSCAYYFEKKRAPQGNKAGVAIRDLDLE
jgi:hypothetical protein